MRTALASAAPGPWVNMARVSVFLFLMLLVSNSWRWDSPHIHTFPLLAFLVPAVYLWRVDRWNKVLDWIMRGWRHLEARGPWTFALVCLPVTLWISFVILGPYPHVPDGYSYLFQAKLMAAGRVSTPDVLNRFFEIPWNVIHNGQVFSHYPPGWPALLALGVMVGLPAAINPLVGALTIPVTYLLVLELSDRRHARLCALFALLSPFFLFMSSNFLSHASCLLFTALAALFLLRAHRLDNRGLYLLAGLAAGAAFLVRPPDALVAWMVMALFILFRGGARGIPRLALASTGFLLGIGIYLCYNRALMGEWFTPLHVLTGTWNRFGFAGDIGAPDWEDNFREPGHTPWRSLLNLNFNMVVLGTDLFGWPISSLTFAILLLCFGRKSWGHWFSLWMIGGISLLYAGLWYHGICFGARYYYTALPYFLFLTVSGIVQLPSMAERHFGRHVGGAGRFVRTLVALLFVYSAVFYLPYVVLVVPYHNFCDFHDATVRRARRDGVHNAIVFVSPPGEMALPALAANRYPPGEGDIIFAHDLGEEANRELLGQYPGRSVHYYKTKVRRSSLKEALEKLYLRKLANPTTTSVNYLGPEDRH